LAKENGGIIVEEYVGEATVTTKINTSKINQCNWFCGAIEKYFEVGL